MNISELLKQDESETLDFKASFHTNNVKLVHDILCLANAYGNGNRFLVFGVTDDKKICGIESDPNRKTNAAIQDLLRQSHFNRIPSIKLHTRDNFQGHTLAILEILNRPDKPFFLTKDKKENKNTIRAGVIYSRICETNIPLAESAPEDIIELMWRERFGFALDPLSRLERLLDKKADWVNLRTAASYIYHRSFPEFTIQDGKTLVNPFVEPWTKKFPDPSAQSYYVEVRYHSTILKQIVFVSCDGGRYRVPLPQRDSDAKKWFIQLDSLEYKISLLYSQYFPLPQALASKGIRFVVS